ncbi:MAG: hypothetical protein LBE83_05655 [Propionibacteriaceae bacterium]|jgi:hypothetical protein|nr:hypothetical protein [Propionibacteriaceae bacterium]
MRDHSLLNTWAAAHTALLVEGQTRLSSVIGTDYPAWEMNVDAGLLTLHGTRLQFALLGRVDEETNAWTWAWSDRAFDSRAIAVQRSWGLREFGMESGLWQFVEPTFPMAGIVDLGMTPGSTIAMVGSPQILGYAIFSGIWPGGRVYMAITDPRLSLEPASAFTAPKHISGALAYGLGRHRDIVTVYAAAHHLDVWGSGDLLTLVFEDDTRLEITFDDRDRIRRLHGVVPGGA